MTIPLNVNGAIFEYPVDFDESWGVDATGWAQAITNGTLQRQGGSFPLTADVNFGASFGLLAAYYKSRSSNTATAGTIRLSSADAGVAFRNNANSGNLILTTDASDNLLYNGHIVGASGAGPVTSITGTANQIIASASTGAITLSAPQNIDSTATPTFGGETLTGNLNLNNLSTLNFKDSGSAHTIGMVAPSTTANYTITLPPTAGSNGQVLQTNGSGTTTWVNAAGGGTVNSGTANQLAYYATTGAAISGQASITLSGSNVSLNSNKIVSLANGTAPTDATAFGQVQYGFQTATQLATNSSQSLSSVTFAVTPLVSVITPTSSSSRIKITVTGAINLSAGSDIQFTLQRNGANVVGSQLAEPIGPYTGPISITYIDSPATTSSVTYSLVYKVAGGAAGLWVGTTISTMILEELR